MRLGLQFKLVSSTMTLAVVGLLVTTFIGYQKSKDAIETANSTQQMQAVDGIARNARFWIDSRVLEVGGWAQTGIFAKALEDSFLGKAARKAAAKQLNKILENYPFYDSIYLAKADGTVIAAAPDEAAGAALTGDESFQQAAADGFAAAHAVKHPVSGKPVSILYASVKNAKGGSGVLVATVALTGFGKDFVTPAVSGETGRAMVFGQDGQLILSSGEDAAFSFAVGELGIQPAEGVSGGAFRNQRDGALRLGAFRQVEDLQWTAIASAEEDEILAAARSALLVSILTAAVVALVIGAGVFLVVKAIVRPIRLTVDSLRDLSQGDGDLTRRLDVRTQDEMADLATYFNLFMEKLQRIITQVQDSTSQVARLASDLSGAAGQTRGRMERQSSEIEMVASAVTEMAATAQSVAGNAVEAADFATKVDSEAENGRAVVANTISSIDNLAQEVESSAGVIGALRSKSESIGTVLDVIKGIAEQTNLLALNAAIEAARAGDLGRGFAVVADEVRTLAQRTQTSTQEIEQMIQGLQTEAGNASQRIEISCKLAQDTVSKASDAGAALESITKAVLHITEMNQQIASAAEEQSAVTGEITRNVTNIHNVTEETASATEQTSRTSLELDQSSASLQEVVTQFKV